MLDPANATAHAGLAASLEASDTSAARSEAMAAIKLQPSAEAYLVLARLDLRDNKLQEASDEADRAIALDPANASAQNLKRDIATRPTGAPAPPQP